MGGEWNSGDQASDGSGGSTGGRVPRRGHRGSRREIALSEWSRDSGVALRESRAGTAAKNASLTPTPAASTPRGKKRAIAVFRGARGVRGHWRGETPTRKQAAKPRGQASAKSPADDAVDASIRGPGDNRIGERETASGGTGSLGRRAGVPRATGRGGIRGRRRSGRDSRGDGLGYAPARDGRRRRRSP